MRRSTLWLALAFVACAPDGLNPGNPSHEQPGDDDTNTPPGPVPLSAPAKVIGVPNVDDDLRDKEIDWLAKNADDDDMAPLTVVPSSVPDLELTTWRLTLDDRRGLTRVWHDGAILLDVDQESAELPWSEEPLELRVEFGEAMLWALLTVEELDADEQPYQPVDIELTTGPLLLNHHLQPTESVFVVGPIHYTGYSNVKMLNVLKQVLGPVLHEAHPDTYDGDVWIQDEIEAAYFTGPDDQRVDVILDSIRDRGLDPFPKRELRGPGVGVRTMGQGNANTLDSFGNLEVTPPLSANGVDYPFGRIYYGGRPGYMPVAKPLFDYLAAQQIQAPFLIDTYWLCVSHVDEIMTFVPDPEAPRGFRFVYTDIDLGYEILDAMDPTTSLTRFAPNWSHGYTTAGAMASDNGLRMLNEDLKALYLDPILQQMTDELDLTADEIVFIPGIFEEVPGCGGYAGALVPGMANLLVANLDEGSHLFIADPFMRTTPGPLDDDPFVQAVRDVMPEDLNLHFVDDFDVYHLGTGEVHCGTNSTRTPIDDWWEHMGADQ